MLGRRPRLAWGPVAAGPAKSLKVWSKKLLEVEQEAMLMQYKGGHTMYQDIQRILSLLDLDEDAANERSWFGVFSQFNILVDAQAVCSSRQNLFFSALPDGQLQQDGQNLFFSALPDGNRRVCGIRFCFTFCYNCFSNWW